MVQSRRTTVTELLHELDRGNRAALGELFPLLYTELRADDDDALIDAIRHGRWEPLDRVNAGIPSAVTRILERCLAKDSDDRYGTAEELLSDLEALVLANTTRALSALDEPGAAGSLQQDTLRGYIQAVMGRQTEARKVLGRLALLSRTQNVSPWHSAIIHMGLGEHDGALDLIEQAYRDRDWQVRMVPVEPILDPLRSHPRFRVLVDQLR